MLALYLDFWVLSGEYALIILDFAHKIYYADSAIIFLKECREYSMKRCGCLLFFLLIFLCGGASLCAYAEADPLAPTQLFSPQSARLGQWMVGVGGGADDAFFESRANHLLVNDGNNAMDVFSNPRFPQTSEMAQIFVGYRWPIFSKQYLSLQLEYDYLANTVVDGQRTPSSSTISYPYVYHFHRRALLLLAKMDLIQWHAFMPYLQLGMGATQNTFFGFNDDAVPALYVMPDFPNASHYDFCAVIGAGIDWEMTRNLLLSLGDRFGYWGYITSGVVTQNGAGQALSRPIQLRHKLYSNQYVVSLSYLF